MMEKEACQEKNETTQPAQTKFESIQNRFESI